MHQRKGLGVQFNRGIEKQHKERPAKRNCLCLIVMFLLFVICIGQTLICTRQCVLINLTNESAGLQLLASYWSVVSRVSSDQLLRNVTT